MALLCLLATVMCGLLLPLHSKRLNRDIAHEMPNSGHSEDADMTAVAYDEKVLACELGRQGEVQWKRRLIIQEKDAPLADYYSHWVDVVFYGDDHKPNTINCKTFTPPPKPSSVLTNLTTHTLPDDVIGLIGSFNHDSLSGLCLVFDMTFLQKCRTAFTGNKKEWAEKWARIAMEVREEGGLCDPYMLSGKTASSPRSRSTPCQTCMTSPKANEVALCSMQSEVNYERETREKRDVIKDSEDDIRARQKLLKKKNHQHHKFIKESQEFIKKKQETIKETQDYIDLGKQNIVYLKQIFEGQ